MKILKSSRGLALFMSIAMMTIFLFFLSASLYLTRVDTKVTSNLKLATQALEVADAGLQHALVLIANGYDFDSALDCGTPPCPVVSNVTFPAGSGFSYTIMAENDQDDISNGGSATDDTNNLLVLTSKANGPADTKSEIQAYVRRSSVGFTPPAALYAPATTATVTFPSGTGFFITGDDTAYDGSPASNPRPAIPGIATINDTASNEFKDKLTSTRYDLVQGKDYSAGPPIVPSVFNTGVSLDVSQIAQNFQNNATVSYLNGLVYNSTDCPSSIPCTLGTDASPQITYIEENLNHIHFDGYVTGSGVLVVKGDTHIYGNFTFHGLIINIQGDFGTGFGFPDDPEPFSLKGNAKVFGGVLFGSANGDQRYYMEGNTGISYSSEALTMANSLCGSCFPQPARIAAWLDK